VKLVHKIMDSIRSRGTNDVSPYRGTVTQIDKNNALQSMNGMDTDGMGNYIPDMPRDVVGGEINLVRAIYTQADDVIKRIDRELGALEIEKSKLLLKKQAHVELLAVATRFVNELTITIIKK
jgi:hypothetical protein